MPAPLVIAHRTGPHDSAENSLAGIRKAASLGADAVEIDVRRSRDGRPMILHDRWLLRTTGFPLRLNWVSEARVARLRLFRGNGERVPTLGEALSSLDGTMRAAIDVKDPGAGPVTVEEIRRAGVEDRVMFWSQHEAAVRVAVRDLPDVEAALLRDTHGADEMQRYLDDTERFGATAISAHWSQVSPELRARCDERGLTLYSWCRSPDIDPVKLALLDGIVTDWPATARAAVGALDDRTD